MDTDTIAAIATPTGAGGVAIIRISGPAAFRIAAAVLGVATADIEPRRVHVGIARDRAGARLDQVLWFALRAPRSFTGEDVAELHGHGGSLNIARLLRTVITAGARHAEPGEFSRRAFRNGRLDLTRASAIADVINAASDRALRIAQAQLAGSLGAALDDHLGQLVRIRAELEAQIDFPDDELDTRERDQLRTQLAAIADALAALIASYPAAAAITTGVVVTLVGRVNVGKSSLFNALIGRERALVSSDPGTTRDFVEADVVWSSIKVTLTDTAGWREAQGVEKRGIELGRASAESADLIVEVAEQPAQFELTGDGGDVVAVLSKADRHDAIPVGDWIATSAHTGLGLDELRTAIVSRWSARAADADDGAVVTSERQRDLIRDALGAIHQAMQAFDHHRAVELIAADLARACSFLERVLGRDVGDDVLDQLFARFCIGK